MKKVEMPTVIVAVLSYNQDKFIGQCLRSILQQKGEFLLKIMIFDDCSTDDTLDKINQLINTQPIELNEKIEVFSNLKNKGMVGNFKKVIQTIKNMECDYWTIIDGDDYYCSEYRISRHINFLENNKECVLSFNQFKLYFQFPNKNDVFEEQPPLNKEKFTVDELVLRNFIGNISCSFFRKEVIHYVPDELFNIFIGDWLFHIYLAQYGLIGYIKEPLSVYRKHAEGIWTGSKIDNRIKVFYQSIKDFNQFLDFKYNEAFQMHLNQLEGILGE